MQILLIGHRGTGKTSLLQRLQIYSRGTLPVFDLDREIEKKTGLTTAEFFQTKGEEAFREQEKSVIQHLLDTHPKMVCSLGAGFPLESFAFPPSVEFVWVRRSSDSKGRIFLDRPRLNFDLDPLTESKLRYRQRDSIYSRHCDWIYWAPEGLTSPDDFEKQIWSPKLEQMGGILTLRPDHFRNPKVFKARIAQMGVDFFELRSDLLNSVELGMALEVLKGKPLLVAIRGPVDEDWTRAIDQAQEVDGALENENFWNGKTSVVSLHDSPRFEQLQASVAKFEKFEKEGLLLKWSPLLEDFRSIEFGLNWQKENPSQRNFLPRSQEGRWAWVRLWLKGKQALNFVRDGDGSAKDQPTLHEWLRAIPRVSQWGAVLGQPVSHSYSPLEHLEDSLRQGQSFFAIELAPEEWSEAWPILNRLGLVRAAVTSPLKAKAFEQSKFVSEEARELQSVNTLTKTDEGWRGHNTDLEGFRELLDVAPSFEKAMIWGGGGTLAMIQKILPQAVPFSVRTREARGSFQSIHDFDCVIWAASPEADLPPEGFHPKVVIDLNYRDDSRAKEYALKHQASYLSGLLMFRTQAAAQREEWKRNGK